MAVNHADGMIFTSVIFCPIAAAVGAAHAGAGWLTILFIPVGLAAGVGIIYVGGKLVYAITGFGLSRASKMPQSWIQQVFFAPFFLLYMILPLAILWAGVFGIWAGSIWVVRHVL